MDYIVHGVANNRTQLSEFHILPPNSLIILSPGDGQVGTFKATVGKKELVQQSLLGVPVPLDFWHETTF